MESKTSGLGAYIVKVLELYRQLGTVTFSDCDMANWANCIALKAIRFPPNGIQDFAFFVHIQELFKAHFSLPLMNLSPARALPSMKGGGGGVPTSVNRKTVVTVRFQASTSCRPNDVI